MHTADARTEHAATAADKRGQSPWSGLSLALVAGAIVWGAIQITLPLFQVAEEFHVGMGDPPERFVVLRQQQDIIDRNHAMIYIGGLGLLIGVTLGIGDAVVRRSWLPPLTAALLGAVGGAAGGFLGCLVYEYVRANVGQAELQHTIFAQVLLAAPLGFGIGSGLGLAQRTISGFAKSTLAGVAAGVLAGIIYPVAVSVIVPEASTNELLPDQGSSRLLWLGIVSGVIGLVIPIAGRRKKQTSAHSENA